MSGGYGIGVDIGGTFTDFVLLDEDSGGLRLHKKLTTPDDPARGAVEGLEELLEPAGVSLADCSTLVHGTTLVTNALIERRGVKTALLTTRGFGDILEMGREQRYDIYDLFLQYPEPLVPRRWRAEVDERMTRDGESLRAPDLQAVHGVLEDLLGEGVEAVAVCFLHSYRNSAHEGAVADAIRRDFPQLSVSVSSEVVPEIREFERTSTTVCNAYVQPLVDRYLGRLEEELAARGFDGRFLLMQSSGGLAAPETVRRFPVRLLESGPAGGAAVAAFLSRALDVPELISFDMGGTTAKVCLVRGGEPDLAAEMEAARVHRFKKGSGITVKAPVVDLIEIGAGGGSIAGSDRLGLLRVGPRSAGADPGPASYGLGGERPTVTDACLVLGYFDPDYFLGGTMTLDLPAAERALEGLGRELGLSKIEAAWGVYNVVCENMASAARVHIIEKGQDPRRFPMIAFGGAGPAHATRVARTLGAPEVVVPPVSGVASALGFLVTPASFEFARSRPGELRSLHWQEVAGLYDDMEEKARGMLAASGVSPDRVRLERRAEMRLSGQFHDIEVPVPKGSLTKGTAQRMAEAFDAEYRRLFHAVPPGYEPMVLNWRLRASGPEPGLRLQEVTASLAGVDGRANPSAPPRVLGSPKGRREAYFPEAGGYVETPVYDRYELGDGFRAEGPVIVEEKESTVVANPGDILKVDGLGNIRIEIGGGS
jgi:N-methylhydantoinase A/oxoprolinase/acetone carboxylase beta subunit